MITFIDEYRADFGVGSICKVLQVAPSSYYANLAIRRDPRLAADRARQDVTDSAAIRRVHDESRGRYGARKIWHQLRRENKDIARCTVERLMKLMGLQGVVRGKQVITTNPDVSQPCPDDKVNREFKAQSPNQLWVSDFTYVSTAARQHMHSMCERGGRAWFMSHLLSMSSLERSLAGAYRHR